MDEFVRSFVYPYEVLPNIKDEIVKIGKKLGEDYIDKGDDIYIHKTARVSDLATILGPAIIDCDAEIRPGAFIRGSVVIGKRCVLGNSCEVKNSIFYDDVQVPHFNYVGDSILGNHSHMGAGAIISNLKNDKKNVSILFEGRKFSTDLRKVGAFLGDNVDIGCNSVLNPGTIIGHDTKVYPLSMVRGFVAPNMIFKDSTNLVERKDV